MQWQGKPEEIHQITIELPNGGQSGEQPAVTLTLRTGEVLMLNELSLSSLQLQVRTACVLSVTHAMAALTLLLSSWMETNLQSIVGQPRISTLFLTALSGISGTCDDIFDAGYALVIAPARRKWSRNKE